MNRRGARTVGLAVALLAGACGGDDGRSATPDTVAAGPEVGSTSTMAAPPTTGAAQPSAAATTAATVTPAPGSVLPAAPTADDRDTGDAGIATTGPIAAGIGPPATSTAPTPPAPGAVPRPAPVPYEGPDGFRASVQPIDAWLAARLTPTSWRPGCPVGLDELRYLQVDHWGFDGMAHTGELVVHADAVDAVLGALGSLWAARFPIRRMRLVDDYGGDDATSIEADNTSAFNCRYVAGTTRWSNHATGRAIDVNPLENPYVSNGRTDHDGSVPYLDRGAAAIGMIVEGDAAVAAFDAVGWGWGGRWSGDLDYQHFSAAGN